MISLTRLNGQTFSVNSDLLKIVESSPDTVITLLTGDKIMVRESPDTVLTRVVEFRRAIYPGPSRSALTALFQETSAGARDGERNKNG